MKMTLTLCLEQDTAGPRGSWTAYFAPHSGVYGNAMDLGDTVAELLKREGLVIYQRDGAEAFKETV